MRSAATETFHSDRLDEMVCGTVELSVPMRRDVIQVGVGGDADVGRIRVRRGPRTMTVSRVDGEPIQVDVVVADDQQTSRVFDEPVHVLTLVRTGRRWSPVGSCIGAASSADVKRFVDVVGTFAVAKQRKIQHSHRG